MGGKRGCEKGISHVEGFYALIALLEGGMTHQRGIFRNIAFSKMTLAWGRTCMSGVSTRD